MNWYEIRAQQNESGETDIFLFDEIGRWGVGADKLISEVQTLKPTSINLHINSPGGSVVDGWAIFNFLRSHPAKVTTYVDSMAASIAGVIALAGDEVVMAEASLFHMHLPGIFGLVDMKVDEVEDLAKALRQMDKIIRNIYREKTGASDDKLEEWFSGETYFTPEEALAEGIVDRIVDRVKMVACDAKWKTKDYDHLEQAMSKSNFMSHRSTGAGSNQKQNHNRKENKMTVEELNNQVTSLKAEAKRQEKETNDLQAKVDSFPEQLENAKKEAAQETLHNEEKRRNDIIALRDKYNKDGDLDASALEAINDGKDAAAYKDEVLELIAARPTNTAMRPNNDGRGESGENQSELEKVRNQLSKETDPSKRGALAKKLRALREGE